MYYMCYNALVLYIIIEHIIEYIIQKQNILVAYVEPIGSIEPVGSVAPIERIGSIKSIGSIEPVDLLDLLASLMILMDQSMYR